MSSEAREGALAGLSLYVSVEGNLAALVTVLDAARKQMADRTESAGQDTKASIEVPPGGLRLAAGDGRMPNVLLPSTAARPYVEPEARARSFA